MPQLDGLRAVAVTLVLVQHAVPPIKHVVPLAHVGVRLFFVLSGFLITGILLRSRAVRETGTESAGMLLRRFYLRRALRIFPIYYLVILTGLAFGVGPIGDAFWWLSTFTSNAYLALRDQWIDGYFHFWTLAIEEQFYLVWPMIVLLAPSRYLGPAMALMFAAALIYRGFAAFLGFSVISTYCLTPACLDSLGMGALIAALLRPVPHTSPDRRGIWQRRLLIAGGAGLIVTWMLRRWGFHRFDVIAFDLALAAFLGGVVMAAARRHDGIAGRFLELGGLRRLGKVSYGVYVYHVFLPALVYTIARRDAIARGLVDPDGLAIRACLYLAPAMLLFPVGSWYLLERPMLRLKDRLDQEPAGGRATGAGPLTAYFPLLAYASLVILLLAAAGYRSTQPDAMRSDVSDRQVSTPHERLGPGAGAGPPAFHDTDAGATLGMRLSGPSSIAPGSHQPLASSHGASS
jgi:peptidoglycan/LPS O-acetylase OafA/YrhL